MTTHTPPTIIAFASPKGGAGKSTSCLCIAGALAAEGHRVTIIDFDDSETLWRWFTANPDASNIGKLTVERAPSTALGEFMESIWKEREGVVLIDLAGALTNQMLHIAAYAHLIITPAKVSEPDIVEANKLYQQLLVIGRKVGKPICHRILLNEVPNILAAFQLSILDNLRASALPAFKTALKYRAAYPESMMSGRPPHFAENTLRPAVSKAITEINELVAEVYATINQEDLQEAA